MSVPFIDLSIFALLVAYNKYECGNVLISSVYLYCVFRLQESMRAKASFYTCMCMSNDNRKRDRERRRRRRRRKRPMKNINIFMTSFVAANLRQRISPSLLLIGKRHRVGIGNLYI